MRFISFSSTLGTSWGILENDQVFDLGNTAAANRRTLGETLRAGLLSEVLAEQSSSPRHQRSEVTLLPPITDAAKIICVGLNYADHVLEMNRPMPEKPVIFTRWNDSLVGAEAPLVAPSISESFDYEGELAVVLSEAAFRVTPEEASQKVFGYSIFNDGSFRDYQRHTHQFTPGKNFPSSGAFGPVIVTADELPHLDTAAITTILDGEIVQSSRLNELIFSIPELISYCSQWTPLQPGDVIATGTPGGVGDSHSPPKWLRPGSVVEITIDGIGSLKNSVIAE